VHAWFELTICGVRQIGNDVSTLLGEFKASANGIKCRRGHAAHLGINLFLQKQLEGNCESISKVNHVLSSMIWSCGATLNQSDPATTTARP
jgi:hypothetical protein